MKKMSEEEKINWLIDPKRFFPSNLSRGALCGNKNFINAVDTYLKILAESQFWPLKRLEEIQVKRLRALTACIADCSLFWSNYFREHGFSPDKAVLKDLIRLPILRRNNILTLGASIYVNPRDEDYPLFTRRGSGTTGISLKLIYSEREFLIGWIPFLLRHPVFEKQSLVELLSRKPFVVLGKPGMRYAFEKDFFYRTFEAIQSTDLELLEVRKNIYKSIYETKPAILIGFGSLIAKLAQLALQDNVTLPLMAVRVTSEPISSLERALIHKAFQAPIINWLSGNGIGVLGFECPTNEGNFHLNAENVVLETIISDGNTVRGNDKELIATSLAFTLTPIIRFAQEDLGQFISKICPCGRTLPIFEFTGRRGYDVVLPSGNRIRMILLHSALMGLRSTHRKVKQIQVIQKTLDSINILIVRRAAFSDGDELAIRLAVSKLFGGEKMLIDIEYVEDIIPGRSHKPSFFVPLSEFQERKL